MKSLSIFVIACSCLVFGQSGPPTAGGGQSAAEVRQERMEARQERMAQMREQHDDMMKQMRADLDAMRRKATLLASEALSIQDVNTRRTAVTNAELWQQLVDTMQKHMDAMQQMHEQMGPGMRMGQQPLPPQKPQPH